MTTSAGTHSDLGRRGEDLAARYLEDNKHLVVLSRNWRCCEGELDLVAASGRTLYFCEVKTRTNTDFGTPAEAVTDAKARRIRRLAHRWMHRYGVHGCELRFGIVSVLWPTGRTPTVDYLPVVL
jgi:putative endonuclease